MAAGQPSCVKGAHRGRHVRGPVPRLGARWRLKALLGPVASGGLALAHGPAHLADWRRDRVPLNYSSRSDAEGITQRRLDTALAGWAPIRISVYTAQLQQDLNDEAFHYFTDDVLSAATRWLSLALWVRPVQGALRLQQYCDITSSTTGQCWRVASDFQSCGDATIPREHFADRQYCPNGGQCKVSPGGAGVPNSDFLLYVTARDTQTCSGGGVLAYANTCMQDVNDRPVAGFLNFCKSALASSRDWDVDVATALHEVTHALGFSSSGFPFFRDDTGAPRTPRDARGMPPTDPADGYQAASNTVIVEQMSTGTREFIVLPRPVEAAREYFSCPSLDRVPLEEQGGVGSANSHWEARYMFTEIMSPVISEFPRVSQMTLAVLEDSGWYKPDYSQAGAFRFGRWRGCSFLTENCVVGGGSSFPGTFCADAGSDLKPCSSGYLYGGMACTHDLQGQAECDTCLHDSPLPPQFQYFSNPRIGGSKQWTSYCPVETSYAGAPWCWDSSSAPRNDYYGESYGSASLCIMSTVIDTKYQAMQSPIGTCHDVQCSAQSLQILVGQNTWVTCNATEEGVRKRVSGTRFAGNIICPKFQVACGDVMDQGPTGTPCLFPGVLREGRCVCAPGYLGEDCTTRDLSTNRQDIPFGLRYSLQEILLTVSIPVATTPGIPARSLRPTWMSGPRILDFSVSPTLPAGLSLNATSGELQGTPTQAVVRAAYIVRAAAATGAATAIVFITVDCAPSQVSCHTVSAPTTTSTQRPVTTTPPPAQCISGWRAAPECARNFSYQGVIYQGCAQYSANSAWCSQDAVFAGQWSPCQPCGSGGPSPQPDALDTCLDQPPLWTDAKSKTCGDYALQKWCTRTGGYGTGWKQSWGDFRRYATKGVAATSACCLCGGGVPGNCTSSPVDWADSDGSSCLEYMSMGWCTTSGGPGPGWNATWGTFDVYAVGGVSAKQACCACGGGRHIAGNGSTAPPPPLSPAPAPQPAPSAPTRDCTDDPPTWADTESEGCLTYARNLWCTPTGGYGVGWDADWGTFSDFAVGGVTAAGACCSCGGGHQVQQSTTARPGANGTDTGGSQLAVLSMTLQRVTFTDLQSKPGVQAFQQQFAQELSAAAKFQVAVRSVHAALFGQAVIDFCMPPSCESVDTEALSRLLDALENNSSGLRTSSFGRRFLLGVQLYQSTAQGAQKLWPVPMLVTTTETPEELNGTLSMEQGYPWDTLMELPSGLSEYVTVVLALAFVLAYTLSFSQGVKRRAGATRTLSQASTPFNQAATPDPDVLGAPQAVPEPVVVAVVQEANPVVAVVVNSPDDAMAEMLDRGYEFGKAMQALQSHDWNVARAVEALQAQQGPTSPSAREALDALSEPHPDVVL